jgi:hypothetical protein
MLRLPLREYQSKIAAKGMQMTRKSQASLAECLERSNFQSDIFSGLQGGSSLDFNYLLSTSHFLRSRSGNFSIEYLSIVRGI